MRYWLMKSEPDVFGIKEMEEIGEDIWDGVRNYQARNFLREMKNGDLAFFYHSNTKPPGICGLVEIIEEDIVDPTQFDANNKYFDAKSNPEEPRWRTCKVAYRETFDHYISLDELKDHFDGGEFLVVRKGNRLSVMPVETKVAKKLLKMGRG